MFIRLKTGCLIISNKKYSDYAGLTFVTVYQLEELDENSSDKSTLKVNISGGIENEFTGKAIYGTNEHGDFVLSMGLPMNEEDTASEDQTAASFLMLRPVNGEPEAGTYTFTKKEDKIEELSEEILKKIAEKFIFLGVIIHRKEGMEKPSEVIFLREKAVGSLEITNNNDIIKGKIDLKINGLRLSDTAENLTIELSGEFSANEGLESVGKSRVTKQLEEQGGDSKVD